MDVRTIESPGLAHRSYFVADGADAVVIDPRRDVDVYLELAGRGEHRIRYVLETHRNEDYVVGSTALAVATGAEVLHSGRLDFEYGTSIDDGDEIGVGHARIRALATPGHTPESLTFVAHEDAGAPPLLAFTGDALFAGDTGRVDLLGPARAPQMATDLYASLRERILPLGDGVILLPAHGNGSVCGGAIADRERTTLGYERATNGSLGAPRDEFVRAKLAEKHVRPPYFERMEAWNRRGDAPIHTHLPLPPPLAPGEVAERMRDGEALVDLRMPQAFAGGHVPGAYDVWLEGLSAYLPWVVPADARFLVVLPEGAAIAEVTRRCSRIGYDGLAGYLRGGFERWQDEGRPVARHGTIDSADLRERLGRAEAIEVLDVRKPSEVAATGTIEGARTIFVGELEHHLDALPRETPIVTMCSVGHRGGIAASILARAGFEQVANYLGGFESFRATDHGAR